MGASSHAAQVLLVFWKSSNARMTLDEATSTTGLSNEQVLTVFRQCEPVFKCESISGSGVYRCLLTPPNTLRRRHANRVSRPPQTSHPVGPLATQLEQPQDRERPRRARQTVKFTR